MKTILIIEDSKALQAVYKDVLEKNGYRVIQAFDGKTGLTRSGSEKLDLVLLDVMLPDINGFDVLKQIKQDPSLSKLPVVMLTNIPEEEKSARAAGAKGYIYKTDVPAPLLPEKIKEFFPRFSF